MDWKAMSKDWKNKRAPEELRDEPKRTKKNDTRKRFSSVHDFTGKSIRNPISGLSKKINTSKEDVNFYFLWADYEYDSSRADTIINMYGRMENTNASIQVQLSGFYPHFYIRRPKGWDDERVDNLITMLDGHLKAFIKEYHSKNYEFMQVCKDHARLINMWKPVSGEELIGVWGSDPVDFIDIYMHHPKMVKFIKEMIFYPNGKIEWKTADIGGSKVPTQVVPSWCPSTHYQMISSLQVYEADVDFIVRFIVDTGFKPSSWFSLPAGCYTIITDKKKSRCELETHIKLCDLTPLTDDVHQRTTPDLIELDFDIEVATSGAFPYPDKALYPVTKVSFVLSTSLDSCCRTNVPDHECPANGSCKTINYVFSHLQCKAPPNADEVFCYETERELLEAILDFNFHVDPDIICHHNGNGFDIPYLLNRAKVLGIDSQWATFGRSHKKKVYCKSHSSKGFKKYAACIPGVFNLDILRLAQDDTKLEAHNLQKLSESYLGESKEEIHHTLMAKYQQTAEGREKLSKYNMKDSILVNRIRKKKKYVQNCLGMGDSYVLAQINADRAQGAKIEPQLRLECNKEKKDKDGFITKRRQFKISKRKDEKGQNISYENHEAQIYGKSLKKTPAKRKREDPGEDDDEDREYGQRDNNYTAIAEAALLEASMMDGDEYDGDDYDSLFESQKKLFNKDLLDDDEEDDSYAGATVLKPRCGYYPDDIIITLDFAGMYPSIIRRWNLCFSTLIAKEVAENMKFHRIKRDAKDERIFDAKGQPVQEDFKLEKSYFDETGKFIEKDYFQVSDFRIEDVLDKDGKVIDKKLVDVPDPNGPCFLTTKFKRGTLPAIEDDLAITRSLIKKDMEIVKREMERINIATGINELAKTIDALNKNLADAKKAGQPTAEIETEVKSLQNKVSTIKKSVIGEACADVNASYPNPARDATNLIRPLWLKKKILAGQVQYQKEFEIFKGKTVAQWLKELDRDYGNMDIQQNAKKLAQNSVYGLTGDKTSQYYQKEIATTVTAMGRRMIATIKLEVERTYCKANGYWWDSIVIYGDTDSIFVWLKGFCQDPHDPQARGEAACLGTMMAEYITKKCFIPPIKLDYEKLYTDFVMLGPKNYFGCKWLINELIPKLDIKGLQMIKRGPPLFIKETCKKMVEILILERDYEKALNYAAQRRDMLSDRQVAICDLIQRQKISKLLSSYGKEIETVNKKTGKVSKKKQAVPKFVNLALRILKKNPDREIEEGTILSLVHVDPDQENFGAKSKKTGDRTEEPMTVLLEQIPIDIEVYLTSFDKNMVKILSHPVLHKHPMKYSYTEITSTGIKKSKYEKEEDLRYEKARLEKKIAPSRRKIVAIKRDPTSFPDDAIEKLEKAIEEDRKLMKEINIRIKELEKDKKKKVLAELHSRCKKAKKITPMQQKSALAKAYKLEQVCIGCSHKIPDPNMQPTFFCDLCDEKRGSCRCLEPKFEAPPCGICDGELGKCSHRRSGNSSELCQYCDIMIESITYDHTQTLSKLETEQKQIWDTCAKCMATTVREDLESCIAVECKTLGRRTMIDREIKAQKTRTNELIDLKQKILEKK